MTPEQIKAKELVDKFKEVTVKYVLNGQANEGDVQDEAKECAIIAVDEILNTVFDIHAFSDSGVILKSTIFWEEVKQQINLL